MIVLALIVAFAAWVAGPSQRAIRIRGLWTNALGGGSDVDAWPVAAFVARSKTALRVAGAAVALAILILWNHPKPATVLGVGILLLIYLAVIELLTAGRVRTCRHSERGDVSVDTGPPRRSVRARLPVRSERRSPDAATSLLAWLPCSHWPAAAARSTAGDRTASASWATAPISAGPNPWRPGQSRLAHGRRGRELVCGSTAAHELSCWGSGADMRNGDPSDHDHLVPTRTHLASPTGRR